VAQVQAPLAPRRTASVTTRSLTPVTQAAPRSPAAPDVPQAPVPGPLPSLPATSSLTSLTSGPTGPKAALFGCAALPLATWRALRRAMLTIPSGISLATLTPPA